MDRVGITIPKMEEEIEHLSMADSDKHSKLAIDHYKWIDIKKDL